MQNPGRSGGIEGVQYQKSFTVADKEYQVVALAPSKAVALNIKISKLVIEPLMSLADAGGNAEEATKVLPLAAKALKQNLDIAEVWAIMLTLLRSVEYEGKLFTEHSIDTHFLGDLGSLLKVAEQALEFHCKDFFSALGEAMGGLMTKLKDKE